MKKVLAILATISLMFFQSTVYAASTSITEVNDAQGFIDALKSTGEVQISIKNDIVLDFDSLAPGSGQFMVVHGKKTIMGNNHKVSFSGVMPPNYTSVFQFKSSVEISDLTLEAPSKEDVKSGANQYTPTILSFSGDISEVHLKNVIVRRAAHTQNPQVAINISTRGVTNQIVFDSVFVDGGRIFFDNNAKGVLTLNQSVISQVGVKVFDTDDSDEIFVFKGNSKDGITVNGTDSRLFVNFDLMSDNYRDFIQGFVSPIKGLSLVDVKDATPIGVDGLNVFTGVGLVDGLNNPAVRTINLQEDVVLDYQNQKTANEMFVHIKRPIIINGNKHTVSFNDSVMPHKDTIVFGFSDNAELRDLTFFAPNKTNEAENKYQYSPTLLRFEGADKNITLSSIEMNLAKTTENLQVALFVGVGGQSNVSIDGLVINQGRIFSNGNAGGTFTIKNSVISQESVTYLSGDQKEEVIDRNLGQYDLNALNTKLVVNPTHSSTQQFLVDFLLDFAQDTGIDLAYGFDTTNVWVQSSPVKLTVGDSVSISQLGDMIEKSAELPTLKWLGIDVAESNLSAGKIDTATAGSFTVHLNFGFTNEDVDVVVKTFTVNVEVQPVTVPESTITGSEDLEDVIDVGSIEVQFETEAFDRPVMDFLFELATMDAQEQGAMITKIESMLGAVANFLVLNITPRDFDGNALQVQEGHHVLLTIPVPEGFDVSLPFAIFHVNDDGTLTKLNHTLVDGLISFEAHSFSHFVIVNVEEERSIEDPTETPSTELPSTETPDTELPSAGHASLISYGFSASVLGVGMLWLVSKRKEQK